MNASSEIQLQWETLSAFCDGLPLPKALNGAEGLPGPSSHLELSSLLLAHNG